MSSSSVGALLPPDPDPFATAQRLYRTGRELAADDRARRIEGLTAFLAFVEAHRPELASHAGELAPELDETAIALLRLDRSDLAGRAVELGLGYAPDSAMLLYHKALTLLAQNRNVEFVVPLLDRALAVAPHDRTIWATKGDALRLLGRTEAAVEAYLHAQQLDPASLQYVDRALKLLPRHPGALRAKVELARAQGNERAGLEALEELERVAPGDADLPLYRADLLLGLGRLDEAAELLERLGRARPDDARVGELRLRFLFASGREEEARHELERKIAAHVAISPRSLSAFAEHLARKGQEPDLLLQVRLALRSADPSNAGNLRQLSALALKRQRPELALEAARGLVMLAPGELGAWRDLAELELAVGPTESAFRTYRELVRRFPEEVPEVRKAMVAAQSAGRPEIVREFAETLLKKLPSDRPAREQLARALVELGRPMDAAGVYDELLAARPGEVRYLLEKKEALQHAGRTDLLPAVLDEIARREPGRTDLALERANLSLGEAYARPEGSVERTNLARTALAGYERASSDPERRSSALLGIARASRLVHLSEKAAQAYDEFLALPESSGRADVRTELGHLYREAHRYREAEAEYARALELGHDAPDLLWGEVDALVQLNRETTALRYLELLLLKDPGNPLFLRREGQIQLILGRRSEGLDTLARAAHSPRAEPTLPYEIAEILQGRGEPAEAIPHYEEAIRRYPTGREARLGYARALVATGRCEEAVGQLDRLLHEDPNDLATWRTRAEAQRKLGRTPDLLYSLKAILLLDPRDREALLEKGRLHLRAGETAEALATLRPILEGPNSEGEDPQLLLTVADLAGDLGDLALAERGFELARAAAPSLAPQVAVHRALRQLAAGRPDEALATLDAAPVPEGTEPSVEGLLLRARILAALERPEEARAAFARVREREPASGPAAVGLARLELDQGEAAPARDLLRSVLTTAPPDPDLYLLLAEAESALGSLPEAARVLEDGARALPQAASLPARLAEVRIRAEEWPAAAEALGRAMALEPTNVELALRAGFVAEKMGHEHEALSHYERATEAAPSNKFAWCSRGLALVALGRPEESLAFFDRALALDVDFAAAKEGRTAAQQRMREREVERFGREALLLEGRLGRPAARNDLFVSLQVPYDLLEPVQAALARTPKIDLARLSEQELHDLEAASCQLVTAALERRPDGLERRGLTLSDVALLAPPSYSLGELQKLFGYVRAVLDLELKPENLRLTPDVEELARRALTLPDAQRTLFELVRTLRVGLYKARIIKAVESAGGTVHAPLPTVDLGQFTPEFRPGEPEPESSAVATLGTPAAGGFFPADDEAAHSPPVVPAGPPAPAPAHAGSHRSHPSAPRCVGCGGIASVVHGCSAALCHACIAQYRTCPKCGLVVDVASSSPVGLAAPRAAPAPRSGALRGFLGKAKSTIPRRGPSKSAAATPPAPAHSAPGHSAPAHSAPAAPAEPRSTAPPAARPRPASPPSPPAHPAAAGPGATAPRSRAASSAPKTATPPASEPPAPPPPAPAAPPRPPREKRDDEPRL
jgi:tetratricopeptide (TPR) repeat protein